MLGNAPRSTGLAMLLCGTLGCVSCDQPAEPDVVFLDVLEALTDARFTERYSQVPKP